MIRTLAASLVVALACAGAARTAGQCSWTGLGSGVNGRIYALTSFDDGTVRVLLAGGLIPGPAGQPSANLAAFDGVQWTLSAEPLFAGGGVTAFGAFAAVPGQPPKPFAGGGFPGGLAMRDQGAWQVAGGGVSGGTPGPAVYDLAVFDDGSGPALFVAGTFTTAGGVASPLVAKWDGSAWHGVGGGLGTGFVFDIVRCFAVFDDGSGPALYAGGSFAAAGGAPIVALARWDGVFWTPVGAGLGGGSVSALRVLDTGGGPALHAVGSFTTAGLPPAPGFARWDGLQWTPLPAPPLGSAMELEVFDDGSGPALYAGRFNINFGAILPAVLRWDGNAWSVAANGTAAVPTFGFGVLALGVHDLGSGPRLFAGGEFATLEGVPAPQVAALACPTGLRVLLSQPGGPGTPVRLVDSNLTPGRAYFNLVSHFPAPGGPGTGPASTLGLDTPYLPFLLRQLALPQGTHPFHVVAPAAHVAWGPYLVPPMIIDVVCLDATGGVLGPVSPVQRFTVY